MKIVYKHQAVLDIRQTQEYIAETLGNKRAAQKLVASILKAISLLEENPMMGVSMGAKFEIKTSIRFFIVAKHLVFMRSARITCFLFYVYWMGGKTI